MIRITFYEGLPEFMTDIFLLQETHFNYTQMAIIRIFACSCDYATFFIVRLVVTFPYNIHWFIDFLCYNQYDRLFFGNLRGQ